VRFCLRLLLISIILLLQSCYMSPRMTKDFQWGKANFNAGRYKCSFRQLMPVAVNGCAEAQYAVGYMYYYGYGITQDDESGLFWMERAAAQGYCPAIKALELIRQQVRLSACPELAGRCDPSIVSPYRGAPCLRNIRRQDAVLESLITERTTYTPTRFPRLMPERVERRESLYTLQLFGAYELIDVKDFQAQYELQRKARISCVKRNGKNWYILTLGRYASVAEAKQAENRLPCRIRDLGPWVRKVCGLKPVY
jgi:TPR repeat protein